MNSHYHILVVDDERAIARLLQRELQNEHRQVHAAHSSAEALRCAQEHDLRVALVDIRLPDASGIDLMQQLRDIQPDMEVICITGHGTIGDAVEAMKLGAYDYITKPFSLEELGMVVERAHQKAALRTENRRLRHTRPMLGDLMVGEAPAMREVRYLLERVAPTDVPVLLTGSSGAGKEVLAHAIQRQSRRSESHFIIKNCATLQKDLARSELFGHVRGSFTGAHQNSAGLFTEAHKGTLFMDEIGELPLDVQPSLLRVLENGSYRPVGDNTPRNCDIRFIFATNRNLAAEVEAGRFNEALFHRINVFTIKLPSLHERPQDIPLLVDHFLHSLPVAQGQEWRVDPQAMRRLMAYDWPGNVRELRNVIERGVILAENGLITPRCLPGDMGTPAPQTPPETVAMPSAETPSPAPHAPSLKEAEIQQIQSMLHQCGGNRTLAARQLGISRKTLYRKLQTMGQ